MRNDLKRFFLRALDRMSGTPLPQPAMFAAARGAFPGVLESEIDAACRDLEVDGFISASRDNLDGLISWTLTIKGQHKANAIR